MQAFYKVLAHAGIEDPAEVTDDMVNLEDKAFVREQEPEPDISEQVARMREAFAQPMAELQLLMDEFWPAADFRGIPEEL